VALAVHTILLGLLERRGHQVKETLEATVVGQVFIAPVVVVVQERLV
jgi:hypothetical protein